MGQAITAGTVLLRHTRRVFAAFQTEGYARFELDRVLLNLPVNPQYTLENAAKVDRYQTPAVQAWARLDGVDACTDALLRVLRSTLEAPAAATEPVGRAGWKRAAPYLVKQVPVTNDFLGMLKVYNEIRLLKLFREQAPGIAPVLVGVHRGDDFIQIVVDEWDGTLAELIASLDREQIEAMWPDVWSRITALSLRLSDMRFMHNRLTLDAIFYRRTGDGTLELAIADWEMGQRFDITTPSHESRFPGGSPFFNGAFDLAHFQRSLPANVPKVLGSRTVNQDWDPNRRHSSYVRSAKGTGKRLRAVQR
jgi:hypothetical protein